jgi:hypothetical protein
MHHRIVIAAKHSSSVLETVSKGLESCTYLFEVLEVKSSHRYAACQRGTIRNSKKFTDADNMITLSKGIVANGFQSDALLLLGLNWDYVKSFWFRSAGGSQQHRRLTTLVTRRDAKHEKGFRDVGKKSRVLWPTIRTNQDVIMRADG